MKRVLIVDNGSKYIDELIVLVKSCGVEVDVVGMSGFRYKNGDLSGGIGIDECSCVVLSGGGKGRSVVEKPSFYRDQIDLCRSGGVPVIGVCLGFEIVAYSFGADLVKSEWKINGEELISVENLDLVGWDFGANEFVAYEHHVWRVDDAGDELIVLGRSRHGVEIVKHRDRDVAGMQFHPEIKTDNSWGDEVFRYVLKDFVYGEVKKENMQA